ncbi:hypothetical protein [Bilophila wadsworthia]|uniref:hypothetical protein n=1 Tax=Bilophila wadsworthia TaxID=35833 RepID=UPI003AB5F7E7
MAVRTVRSVQGQAWDQISKAEYGAEKLLNAVLEANAEEADAVLFSGDMPVTISSVDVDTQRKALDLLPPWERV